MSIVTLKKKSQAMHSQISKNEFNINGTLRAPPHNIFRTPTYTRMKGPDPVGVGAGSHCRVGGREARVCKRGYPVNIIDTGEFTYQTVANKSTYSNVSMLGARFRKFVVGPLAVAATYPTKDSSEHVEDEKRKNTTCVPLVGSEGSTAPCRVTKDTNKYVVTYADYMLNLKSKCTKPNLPVKIWHTNTIVGSCQVPMVDILDF